MCDFPKYFSCKELFKGKILLLSLSRNYFNAIFFYYHSLILEKENYTRRHHLKGCRQKEPKTNNSLNLFKYWTFFHVLPTILGFAVLAFSHNLSRWNIFGEASTNNDEVCFGLQLVQYLIRHLILSVKFSNNFNTNLVTHPLNWLLYFK